MLGFQNMILLFLAVGSGLLFNLTLPTYNMSMLSWVACVPLLLAIRYSKSLTYSFFLGWISGFTIYMFGVWWLTIALTNYAKASFFLAIINLIIFSLYHGLIYGLWSFLIKLSLRYGLIELVFIPLSYTLILYFFPVVYPFSLSVGLASSNYFSQLADLIGFNGLNVTLIIVNVLIYWIVLFLLKRKVKDIKCFIYIISIILVLATHFLYAYFRIRMIENTPVEKTLRVLMVQGNNGLNSFNLFKSNLDLVETYLKLSNTRYDLDLIVWPESAFRGHFLDNYDIKNMILDFVERRNIPVLLASDRIDEMGVKYVSSFLVKPDKSITIYDKLNLTPFGEYNPVPIMEKLIGKMSHYTHGTKGVLMEAGNFKILPSICHDIIRPIHGDFSQSGAEIIINHSNDAWYGDSREPFQHLYMSLMKSIETRLPMVRATNTGISAYITELGEIKSEILLNTQGALKIDIPIRKIESFYFKYGDIVLYLFWFIGGLATIVLRFRSLIKSKKDNYR